MTEFIVTNFWLIAYLIIICISRAPGMAAFLVAIYIVFGRIPNWLYVVSALLTASIHFEYLYSKINESKNKSDVFNDISCYLAGGEKEDE